MLIGRELQWGGRHELWVWLHMCTVDRFAWRSFGAMEGPNNEKKAWLRKAPVIMVGVTVNGKETPTWSLERDQGKALVLVWC